MSDAPIVPSPWYWSALGVVVASRLVWFCQLLVLSATAGRLTGAWTRVRRALAISTDERARRLTGQPPADADERHRSALQRFATDRSEALTLGALGLTAWGVLSAIAGSEAGFAPSEDGLRMLFVGVVSTITGPVLFPRAGSEGSRMGLLGTIAVGYAAIVLSLVMFAPAALGQSWVGAPAALVALWVVVMNLRNVRLEMRTTRRLLSGPATASRSRRRRQPPAGRRA